MWRSSEMQGIWEHVEGAIREGGQLLQPTGMWEVDYGDMLERILKEEKAREEEERQKQEEEEREVLKTSGSDWRAVVEEFMGRNVPGVSVRVLSGVDDKEASLVAILVKAGMAFQIHAAPVPGEDQGDVPNWRVGIKQSPGKPVTKLETAIVDCLSARARLWDLTYLLVRIRHPPFFFYPSNQSGNDILLLGNQNHALQDLFPNDRFLCSAAIHPSPPFCRHRRKESVLFRPVPFELRLTSAAIDGIMPIPSWISVAVPIPASEGNKVLLFLPSIRRPRPIRGSRAISRSRSRNTGPAIPLTITILNPTPAALVRECISSRPEVIFLIFPHRISSVSISTPGSTFASRTRTRTRRTTRMTIPPSRPSLPSILAINPPNIDMRSPAQENIQEAPSSLPGGRVSWSRVFGPDPAVFWLWH